jgi:hypothetical protein
MSAAMPSLLMTRMPTLADCTLVSHMDMLTQPNTKGTHGSGTTPPLLH